MESSIVYFENPGPQNTDAVVNAVAKRLGKGDIQYVVAASDSGETTLKLARATQGKATVIDISMGTVSKDLRSELEKLGVKILENQIPAFRAKDLVPVKMTYYTLGQGFKVAVEVITIAASEGSVKLYSDVIGVGGTGEGADTAIVARATKPEEMLGKETEKKMEVREILTMPLHKKWW